jgi:hypothetical protein
LETPFALSLSKRRWSTGLRPAQPERAVAVNRE